MTQQRLHRLWPIALIALACAADAQSPSASQSRSPEPSTAAVAAAKSGMAASPGSPLDPEAATPTWVYRSPFNGARGVGTAADPTGGPLSWAEANRQVQTIGGWRAYAREAQAPEPAGSAPGGSDRKEAMPMASPSMPMAPKAPMVPAMKGHQHGGSKP